jgi:uncharacterized protein YbgA (DUF1722 family)
MFSQAREGQSHGEVPHITGFFRPELNINERLQVIKPVNEMRKSPLPCLMLLIACKNHRPDASIDGMNFILILPDVILKKPQV